MIVSLWSLVLGPWSLVLYLPRDESRGKGPGTKDKGQTQASWYSGSSRVVWAVSRSRRSSASPLGSLAFRKATSFGAADLPTSPCKNRSSKKATCLVRSVPACFFTSGTGLVLSLKVLLSP